MGDAQVGQGVALQVGSLHLAATRLIGKGESRLIWIGGGLEDFCDEGGDIISWLKRKTEVAVFRTDSNELGMREMGWVSNRCQ